MSSRPQTMLEEFANSLSHGLALLVAIAMAPVLIVFAVRHGNVGAIVGAGIFSGTMVLLYLSSVLYHAVRDGRARQYLLKLDLGAIYLFIAGSYTPFSLHGIEDRQGGWHMLVLVWLMAFAGVALRLFGKLAKPIQSSASYLIMGWMVLIAAYPLASHLAVSSVAWLVAGGVAYSVGVIFFVSDARLRFGHAVWHVFVMAGSACHYAAVFGCIS